MCNRPHLEKSFLGRLKKAMNTWLIKSAPDEYSLESFKRDRVTQWTGVRNYQARNNLAAMCEGDIAYFYYSQISPPAIVAECVVERSAYPDPTQFDSKSEYFDEKSSKIKPRWSAVDIKFIRAYDNPLSIDAMRSVPGLKEMALFKSSRLSVQPVTAAESKILTKLLLKGK